VAVGIVGPVGDWLESGRKLGELGSERIQGAFSAGVRKLGSIVGGTRKRGTLSGGRLQGDWSEDDDS
jgi:hypothetical protein